MDLVFQSSLPHQYREPLERLVFFNPNQISMQAAIAHALDLYGAPAVALEPAGLTVRIQGCPHAQCLFALEPAARTVDPLLAGMLVYVRTGIEELLVLHIAVSEVHGRTRRSGLGVAMRLIRELRAAARRLRGIRWIRLLYTGDRQFQIRIGSTAEGAAAHEPAREWARLVS